MLDRRRDGRTLAATNSDDGGSRLWQVPSRHEEVSYRGYAASVEQIAYSPNGRHLITAHGDGTVRVSACEACGPIEQVRAQAATLMP